MSIGVMSVVITQSVFFSTFQVMVIFAYAVAILFFDVYDMAIDTIFLCFCEYIQQKIQFDYLLDPFSFVPETTVI